jgi:hypothetical protein
MLVGSVARTRSHFRRSDVPSHTATASASIGDRNVGVDGDVIVIVIEPVIVAALGNGNDLVAVIAPGGDTPDTRLAARFRGSADVISSDPVRGWPWQRRDRG